MSEREQRLRELLQEPAETSYEPPPDLLGKILDDIPDNLPISAAPLTGPGSGADQNAADNVRRFPFRGGTGMAPRHTMQVASLAAAMLAIVAAGYLAWRVRPAGAPGLGETVPVSAAQKLNEAPATVDAAQSQTSPDAAPEQLRQLGYLTDREDQKKDSDGRVAAIDELKARSKTKNEMPTFVESLDATAEALRVEEGITSNMAIAQPSSQPSSQPVPEGRERAETDAFARRASRDLVDDTDRGVSRLEKEQEELKKQLKALPAPPPVAPTTTGYRSSAARQQGSEAATVTAAAPAPGRPNVSTGSGAAPSSEPEPVPNEAGKGAAGQSAIVAEVEAPAIRERLLRKASEAADPPADRDANWPPFQNDDPDEVDDPTDLPSRPEPLFTDTSVDPLSTFGLDVDTASYTQVRNYLLSGALPPAHLVRPEEMLNAFDLGVAAPTRETFRIDTELATQPFDRHGALRLRVSLKAREVLASERRAAALTFVVDTSGSMRQNGRLEMVREALLLLLDELRSDDRVALVRYSSDAAVLVPPTADKAAVRNAVLQLQPGGSTNLEAGLVLGYQLAEQAFRDSANNRVVLLSDGVANVGNTEAMRILQSVADWATRGVELNTVGVGMGDYNDELLERLADRGDGRYAYVDSLREARRLFVESLTGTLETVAKDARVQVRFDPAAVAGYRRIGYENRELPDEAFRHPNTDAGEIGAGHQVTVLYDVIPTGKARRQAELAEVSLRFRDPASGEFVEQSARSRGPAASWDEATPAFRLGTVVATFAELLQVGGGSRSELDALFRQAQQVVPSYPGRTDVTELATLIGLARDLVGR